MKRVNKKELRRLCDEQGLELREYPNEHYQIRGMVIVNWYPTSKRQTVYINGCVDGIPNCSQKKALRIARGKFGAELASHKASRAHGTWIKSEKTRLLKKSNQCHWCPTELAADTATLEHIVPISKGGSNRRDNLALACEPCNSKKANRLGAPQT